MQNNRDRNGRPHFFAGLLPLAHAIAALPPAKSEPGTYSGKLGKAQAKRDRRAARDIANRERSQ